jgi:hypothetical protein
MGLRRTDNWSFGLVSKHQKLEVNYGVDGLKASLERLGQRWRLKQPLSRLIKLDTYRFFVTQASPLYRSNCARLPQCQQLRRFQVLIRRNTM